ncbi:hypothetical protein QR680_010986 [Steinernema hermaphroditum]|uniref:Lysozyme n=1 Tax=Steinernema hermaphroditum TaxID=289476 RepID=A0AA39IRX2_9BILA|nr:hypothetical protein QR680_010986 [Steinernema hermaphroditum]
MNLLGLLAFVALSGGAYAIEAGKDQSNSQVQFGYAIDLVNFTSIQSYNCLRQKGYTYAFIGVYHPVGDGSVLPRAAANIQNAVTGGFHVFPYFLPQPQSRKSGAQQLGEVIEYLGTYKLYTKQIWLQVTSPINWPNNKQGNVAFISGILQAANRYNVKVGIYTNWYDWEQITGNWRLDGHQLWYWSVFGTGFNAESAPNVDDFRPFAGFTHSHGAMKQYGIGLYDCQANFNRNIFVSQNAKFAGESVALKQ